MKPIFLCYPKCSTCQKAKRFLEANGADYELRDIVKENPGKKELLKWMALYGGEPKKFFNVSGTAYRELGLKDKVKAMTREEMVEILSTNGMLVKRPELIFEDKVLVGFKEEEWAAALGL
ncbi:arsenate reductase family protein [Eubacterium sp. 1001713B170207_170306_E7]|uniref:arsenate reductase family protein n=1 Tax=Eubacterium sp. 1001713B170207_170306_E7 TaxID=2787097 RepID=UPI00189ADFFD|nr:arsenate reductase family protein [Eubacterium sp. 1001713B170207_170306_E7]